MSKKYFVLIGISILLQLIGIMAPFIGVGRDVINITNIPLSNLASLILLMIGLKGLYKDTKNQDFYNGSILAVVGICVIFAGTLVSPMFAGGTFIGPFKYVYKIIENQNDDNLILILTSQFLKSFRALFIVIALGVIFYAISLLKFVKGLISQNIFENHKKRIKKSIRTFAILNVILIVLSIITMTFFIKMVDIIILSNRNMTEDMAFEWLGYLFLAYFGSLLAIAPAVFYYINIIKSVVFVFKTPSNFINVENETIKINNEI